MMDTTNPLDLLDCLDGGRVAVVGSLNADYSVRCERIPAPGETVAGQGLTLMPGGKSLNQAACAALLGARVRMVGAVGSDPSGEFLLGQLAHTGADVSNVEVMPGPSGTAMIEVDHAGENSIVVSPGANGKVDASFVQAHAEAILGCAALGLCLEVPMDAVVQAAQTAHETGACVLLNDSPFTAELPLELVEATDVLLVNEHELAQLLGMNEPQSWDHVAWPGVAAALANRGFRSAVVTLGSAGSVVLEGNSVHRVAPVRVETADTTGCGYAFMGALLAGLAANFPLADAAQLASYVGAFAACGQGAMPSYGTGEQIRAHLG